MEMVLVHYGNGQQQVDWGGIRTPYGCCRYFKTVFHRLTVVSMLNIIFSFQALSLPLGS